MKKVTSNQFYDFIGFKDAVIRSVGSFPYTTEYRLRNQDKIIAKIVGYTTEHNRVAREYLVEESDESN